MKEITKQEFDAYEEVRQSGVTNMWAVNYVCDLTNLEREEVLYIMKNYSELSQKYGIPSKDTTK